MTLAFPLPGRVSYMGCKKSSPTKASYFRGKTWHCGVAVPVKYHHFKANVWGSLSLWLNSMRMVVEKMWWWFTMVQSVYKKKSPTTKQTNPSFLGIVAWCEFAPVMLLNVHDTSRCWLLYPRHQEAVSPRVPRVVTYTLAATVGRDKNNKEPGSNDWDSPQHAARKKGRQHRYQQQEQDLFWSSLTA